jgi:hypothetical protein
MGLAWTVLFLVVAASYATALPSVVSDSRLSTLVSLSVIHERDVDLDEYGVAIAQTQSYLSARSGTHVVSVYPYGGPLLAVPLIALADLQGRDHRGEPRPTSARGQDLGRCRVLGGGDHRALLGHVDGLHAAQDGHA